MTKDEAKFIIHDQMPGSDLMGISYKLVNFVIDYLYDNNMEIVDRTLTEEEVRHLDEEIGRSMQFDNPLSAEDK